MKILSVSSVSEIINKHGANNFMVDLISALRRDFERWNSFTHMPRPAMHVKDGVLELMPICDNELYYSFKYVNCHPKNPLVGKQTVVATGQLSRIDTGYPLMFSEMTLLTAFRTAATSALATDLMSRKDAHILTLIGTGAQSEFQVMGQCLVRDIKEVRFYDIDPDAMDKFEKNMMDRSLKLVRCQSVSEAVEGADIVTVCTAAKKHSNIIKDTYIKEGMHINALGGDTIGKTELEKAILFRSRIFVEYFEQAFIEGEIQKLSFDQAKDMAAAQVDELVLGDIKGRISDKDITLFDSVGIALEDYSVLRLIYELSEKYEIGERAEMTPGIKDPKNLVSIINHVAVSRNNNDIMTI